MDTGRFPVLGASGGVSSHEGGGDGDLLEKLSTLEVGSRMAVAMPSGGSGSSSVTMPYRDRSSTAPERSLRAVRAINRRGSRAVPMMGCSMLRKGPVNPGNDGGLSGLGHHQFHLGQSSGAFHGGYGGGYSAGNRGGLTGSAWVLPMEPVEEVEHVVPVDTSGGGGSGVPVGGAESHGEGMRLRSSTSPESALRALARVHGVRSMAASGTASGTAGSGRGGGGRGGGFVANVRRFFSKK